MTFTETMASERTPVIFVGSKESVFVVRTAHALEQRGIPIRILDPRERLPQRMFDWAGPLGAAVFRLLDTRHRLRSLDRGHLVIIHGLGTDVAWLVPLLKSRFARVVGVAYGSDILRRRRWRDWALGPALEALDHIAATNDNVISAIRESFPRLPTSKLSVIRFGLPVIDELRDVILPARDKRDVKVALGLDPDRITVALGYSATAGQRQVELIEGLSRRCDSLPGIQFIAPIQYGAMAVKCAVLEACKNANERCGRARFVPLTDFYDVHQSALLRLATDALINHSISDAFSGTVLETIYAGNLVLAARHLPYQAMPGAGTSIWFYHNVADLAEMLSERSLGAMARKAATGISLTRADLEEVCSWEGVIPAWISLIDGADGY